MYRKFPLFSSHLDLAHHYWSRLLQTGDTTIDCTCGNGHDTLKLCQLVLVEEGGKVYGLDLQAQAIENTKKLIDAHFAVMRKQGRIELLQQCHSNFPASLEKEKIKLIVYNLGYLPGGNKQYTTLVDTTLLSLEQACALIMPGGAISITCYPGHEEGQKEMEHLLLFSERLNPDVWNCCQHSWINRYRAPSLLLLQKT